MPRAKVATEIEIALGRGLPVEQVKKKVLTQMAILGAGGYGITGVTFRISAPAKKAVVKAVRKNKKVSEATYKEQLQDREEAERRDE